MILYVSSSLFTSPAQVLVNTVNTVGVMGKGIALEFKQLYPEMFREYQELCETGKLSIGKLYLFKSPNKWVLNFPTKEHWRHPSKVEYIEAGLAEFSRRYARWGINSIAFPALGCGNGRLDFATQVQPVMHKYLSRLPIEVFIHPGPGEDAVAEHEDPERMRSWLRNEPRSLPFSEVWDDLRRMLAAQSTFHTCTTNSPFDVRMNGSEEEELLVVASGGSRVHILRESLMPLWQQLRDYGFVKADTVPELDRRRVAYVLPLFAELPYVRAVEISEAYSQFGKSPAMGLQILPSAFDSAETVEQMTLFEIA